MDNPFHFNAATSLNDEQISELFIEDYNYSRFIQSKRNVFLFGNRGCGKTMTLLFNKLKSLSALNSSDNTDTVTSYIPIYVPCLNPLNSKREYLLLEDEFREQVVSEHFLSLSVAHSIAETLALLEEKFNSDQLASISNNINYIFDDSIQENQSIFKGLRNYLKRELVRTQKEINRPDSDSFFEDTFTFSSIIMPIIDLINETGAFDDCHFIIMIDDAHDLNPHQQAVLNSWVAFRNNALFSFKVSAAKVPTYSLKTASGGSILRGHDYVSVDVEQPYQNTHSAFGALAKKIVEKRLKAIGLDISASDFFPENSSFTAGIEKAKEKATQLATDKFGPDSKKSITDYTYKYGRAIYFRDRSSKANTPPYSGFNTIVGVSTGVIRNMLEPCFVMYEDALSQGDSDTINSIPPKIQTEVLDRLSKASWETLRGGIDKNIDSCSKEDAKKVENLFNRLAELFRSRLLDESCSEPRAIAFTISNRADESIMNQLTPLLDIARKAQFLYVRSGRSKDRGELEDYYVPNKVLWPSRGLDPIGQHARVSIKSDALLDAAINGRALLASEIKIVPQFEMEL